jgi:hypothetical protein
VKVLLLPYAWVWSTARSASLRVQLLIAESAARWGTKAWLKALFTPSRDTAQVRSGGVRHGPGWAGDEQ